MRKIKAIIVFAIQKAAQGVEYTPKYGAVCPFCGSIRMRTITTRKWDGDTRTRFHRCKNKSCPLHKRKVYIKSVQVDETRKPRPDVA